MTRKDYLRQLAADNNLKHADIAAMLNKATKKYGGELKVVRVGQWMAPGLPDVQPPPMAVAFMERLCAERKTKKPRSEAHPPPPGPARLTMDIYGVTAPIGDDK